MKTYLTIFLALLLSMLSARTAAAQSQFDYAAGIIDRSTALAQAAAVDAAAYPEAEAVIVEDATITKYQPNGQALEWGEFYLKVLTEKGRRENQSLSLDFMLPYEKVEFVLVEAIKKDGTAIPVDLQTHSKVMIDPSQMGMNIYDPNEKVLVVSIPGLEIGDTIHGLTRSELIKPRVPGTWSDYQIFEHTMPIKHAVYEVHAPANLPLRSIALKSKVSETVTYSKKEEHDGTAHRWEIRNVPRIFLEPNMPPAGTVVQRLLVSTISDWSELSRWYWHLSEPHLKATSPALEQKVKDLTGDAAHADEKIARLFRFVSQEIRYLGVTAETEAPGYEPHDVSLTFENRHGVCRDKAALLAAMLRLAGLNAYPVLIYTGPRKDEEVPQPYFNHAIVAAENTDGSYTLMDPTDESTKDLLPAYLNNKSYLVAKPAGERLLASPVAPAEANLLLIESTGRIDANGTYSAQAALSYRGINDSMYRGYLAQLEPEQRKRYFELNLKRTLPSAELTGFSISPANLLDTTQPLVVMFEIQAKNYVLRDKTLAALPLPRLGRTLGLAGYVLGELGLKQRRFPLDIDFTCGVREMIDIELDSGLGKPVAIPESPPIADKTISWKRNSNISEQHLRSENEMLIHVVEFSPDDYLRLKEHVAAIELNNQKMAFFEPQSAALVSKSAAEAEILSDITELKLTNEKNWVEKRTLRKKILTYKGKKENAEVKIDFNPAWEEVRLLEAKVINNGSVKEISKLEQNLMDAPWVAHAPRYSPRKTLVANLPGVEAGSVVEYSYERTAKNQPAFSLSEVFRARYPVLKKRVTLEAPASLPLAILLDQNGVMRPDQAGEGLAVNETRKKLAGNRLRIEWTAENQPRLKTEDNEPPLAGFAPVLQISAGRWVDYVQYVSELLQNAAANQVRAEAAAKELAKDVSSPEGRVQAVRDFVARSIRHAGPRLDEAPLTTITPADQTLQDGYGNTTDRAVLTFTMLRALGFSPEFVLASRRGLLPEIQQVQTQYPTWDLFTDLLVRVNAGPDTVYLNDTDQYASLGALSCNGCLALDMQTKRIAAIEAAPQKQDREAYHYLIKLADDGSAEIAVQREMYGKIYAQERKRFMEMSPEEKKRMFQRLVAEISQSAEALSEFKAQFDSYPGIQSFSVRVKTFAVQGNNLMNFRLPRVLDSLFLISAEQRENPFAREQRSAISITAAVQLPRTFRTPVLVPPAVNTVLPNGGFVRVAVEAQADELTIFHEADIRPFALTPTDYRELVELGRQLTGPAAETIVLRE